MVKDKRYKTVKNLIDGGYVIKFRQIFDSIPKSVLYKHLGMNSVRFKNLMFHVDLFVVKDIFRMANYFEVDNDVMLKLIYNQYIEDHSSDKTNKKVKSKEN